MIEHIDFRIAGAVALSRARRGEAELWAADGVRAGLSFGHRFEGVMADGVLRTLRTASNPFATVIAVDEGGMVWPSRGALRHVALGGAPLRSAVAERGESLRKCKFYQTNPTPNMRKVFNGNVL